MRLFPLIAALALVATPALAANDHAHHGKAHGESKSASKKSKQCKGTKTPAAREYKLAMKRMHEKMDIRYTGDADYDFANGMVPHHQGAVDMAKTLLKYGKDETLRELAKRIIVAQEQEIKFMNYWLHIRGDGYKPGSSAQMPDSTREFMAAMEKMHKDMHIHYTGNADVDFARGMIPHHQGAIDMAHTLRRHGANPQLLELADDIIRSQKQEIALMQEWLAAHAK